MNAFAEKLIDVLEGYCGKECTGECSKCHFPDAMSLIYKTAGKFDGKFVSQGVLEQIRWERDIAIDQLQELGYSLGQTIKNGWIPLETGVFPENGQKIRVTVMAPNGNTSAFETRYCENITDRDKKTENTVEYETWLHDGTFHGWRVIAWASLAEPYIPK